MGGGQYTLGMAEYSLGKHRVRLLLHACTALCVEIEKSISRQEEEDSEKSTWCGDCCWWLSSATVASDDDFNILFMNMFFMCALNLVSSPVVADMNGSR